MSYTLKFDSPTKAMKTAMWYNSRGTRIVLKEARKSATLGKKWTLDTFQIAFSFVGIQGYPVKCFHTVMVRKGLAQ